MYVLIKRVSWLIIALSSVCIGLAACGVNVQTLLHLNKFDLMLRYTVGVCGVASLVMFFVELCLNGCCKK